MALVPFPGPQSRAFDSPLEEDDDASSSKMSFLEHLDELRKRIINSCIAIAVCVLLGFGFIDRIFNFIFAPTRRALPPGVKLIYTQPGEAFSLYIEIALIIGFLLANLKYALLLTFIIAAVITPTGDMMTRTIFAAPMIALYLLSIVIAWIVGPKRQKDT